MAQSFYIYLEFKVKLWYIYPMIKIKNNLIFLLIASLMFSLCSCSINNSIEITDNESITESTSNTVKVTFPEGYTVADIALKLEENGVCSADDFMSEANNTEYLTEFNIEISEPESRSFVLEGYLFPDTYEFYRNENPSSVIKRFIRNFNSKITDEMKARADELGYSLDEILTIASIVQEEAGKASEDKKISSVIHNRLNSSDFPKLQCDACTFYLRDSVKPYVSEEKYEELLQSYSTYNCYGLPEGPITNPGLDSINAALYPDDTDYYFFISDADGQYYYAKTWDEHQQNIKNAGL